MEPLSLRTTHAALGFSFLNRWNCPHEHSMKSWTPTGGAWLTPDSETQIIYDVRLCYLIGPHFWGLVQFVLLPLGWLGPPLGLVCLPFWV